MTKPGCIDVTVLGHQMAALDAVLVEFKILRGGLEQLATQDGIARSGVTLVTIAKQRFDGEFILGESMKES